MTMPEEFQEKLEPPEDFSEINDGRATPFEEAAVELNKTEEIDLESIPARVEADDADSGDNTDDLDPRAEFEKKKEKMEMINSQIDQYSNELTKLRRQLTVLEDEEFKFYTVKGNDNDQTAQKLKYQLTQCHNIVAKENLSDIMKKLEELDNKVKEKLTRDEYINSKVDHIYQKIVSSKYTKLLSN